ncbi:MAG: LuxR C-terminal-related transcriptional regulator [Pseudomonadota bacterium]
MEATINNACRPEDGFSDPIAQTVLNSMSAHIAILDENGVILETNRAWRSFATTNGMQSHQDAIGVNYLEICDRTAGDAAEDAHAVAQGIRDVISGRMEAFLYDYPCHGPTGKHWYYLRVIRMAGSAPMRLVISHEDITALKLAEETLQQREQELEEQKNSLEETNIALKVLLKQRESDRIELEQKVLANVKELVFPYVEKLKAARLSPREKTLVGIVDEHLQDIISPFLQRLSTANALLTPQEIHVAAMVRDGRGSKEIADILNVSLTTVNFHRKNLREKFGLKNTPSNLRSFLLSMT